jgi:hypothetical protein
MTGTGERLLKAISLADFGWLGYTEKLARRCQFFVLEYRGMAPTLPVDVYGAECNELQVATLLKIQHLKN